MLTNLVDELERKLKVNKNVTDDQKEAARSALDNVFLTGELLRQLILQQPQPQLSEIWYGEGDHHGTLPKDSSTTPGGVDHGEPVSATRSRKRLSGESKAVSTLLTKICHSSEISNNICDMVDPPETKFRYPIHEVMNPAKVERCTKSEENLDAFWRRADELF